MVIGDRLRELRESKNLSQGHIEKRTGLLRCYISRVENGHTVPAIETLEKLARALEVPMYQLFHDGEAAESVRSQKLPKGAEEWGSKGNDAYYLSKLRRLLAKMKPHDQKLLLLMVQKVARHSSLRSE
jgi:transcriptional regulator with XRE-family HTH domain